MEQQNKPNILLINCDDMGYGDLGCYGSQLNSTPFLDQLAREGVRFTTCYSASPVCSPSRSSLMTGCYSPRINIDRVLFPGDAIGLSDREYTMPQMFRDNGYRSMIVGKWHCGDQPEFLPLRFGFDAYYGLPYSNDMGRQIGHNQNNPPLPLICGDEIIEEQPDQASLTERYVEQCLHFIRSNRDHPFFLYFAQMHVHLPLYANPVFYKNGLNGDFGACMSEVDWAVHVLVEELKKLGLYENTMIVFTSDNGSRGDHGASNKPLRGTKFDTWEGGVRVPCIMHWKNHLPAGAVCDHMISNIDFLALFAHVIGAELPAAPVRDSLDIYDTVFNGKPVRQHYLYYGPGAGGSFLCAVRDSRFKFFRQHPFGSEYKPVRELYDLENDIGETTNILDQYPEKARELEAILETWLPLLGDLGSHISGSQVRGCGRVEHPKTLTEYDENHPYIIAYYDKADCG